MNTHDFRPNETEFSESGSIISTKKGEFLVGWGKINHLAEPADCDDPLFYFPNFFFTKQHSWYQYEHSRRFTLDEILKIIESAPVEPIPSLNWNNPYQPLYNEQFAFLQKLFFEKKLDKAVPYVYDKAPTKMTPSLKYHCLKNALLYLKKNPAFLIGFWDKEQGCLAVTPELLFEIDQHSQSPSIHTVALGGTFFSNDLSMLKNERLLHEHQIIIDRIINNLSSFGVVHKKDLEALPFANYYHLLTKIHVSLDPKQIPNFLDVIKALHPTPALGASPPFEGMKWLQHYQTLIDRSCYGAPAGFLCAQHGDAKCYVNIRNIQWDNQHVSIAAGGGVTAKSVLELEWMEIQKKIQSIKTIFQIN